jgi:hypothetical protein
VTFLILGLFFGIEIGKVWPLAICSILGMFFMIPVFQMGKESRFLYYVVIVVNTFITGLMTSILYIHEEIDVILVESVIAGVFVVLIVLILSRFSYFSLSNRYKKVLFLLVVLSGYIATITYFIVDESSFSIILFFLAHIVYFYLAGVLLLVIDGDYLKSLSMSTFGLFAAITFIVLVFVSEGEALEAVVPIGSGDKKNKGL